MALEPRKADLLEAIHAERSISGGGRLIGMSYRHAWLLVQETNRCFDVPIVETVKGHGARITPEGLAVLQAYRQIELEAASTATSPAFSRLSAHLRSEPAASVIEPTD